MRTIPRARRRRERLAHRFRARVVDAASRKVQRPHALHRLRTRRPDRARNPILAKIQRTQTFRARRRETQRRHAVVADLISTHVQTLRHRVLRHSRRDRPRPSRAESRRRHVRVSLVELSHRPRARPRAEGDARRPVRARARRSLSRRGQSRRAPTLEIVHRRLPRARRDRGARFESSDFLRGVARASRRVDVDATSRVSTRARASIRERSAWYVVDLRRRHRARDARETAGRMEENFLAMSRVKRATARDDGLRRRVRDHIERPLGARIVIAPPSTTSRVMRCVRRSDLTRRVRRVR